MQRIILETRNKEFEGSVDLGGNPKENTQKVVKETRFFDKSTRANEIRTHYLVNRSSVLNHPKQRKYLDDPSYTHKNHKIKEGPPVPGVSAERETPPLPKLGKTPKLYDLVNMKEAQHV